MRIKAVNRKRTIWAIFRPGSRLNSGGEWEAEPSLFAQCDAWDDFLARTRWPSAEAAWAALLAYRAAEEV